MKLKELKQKLNNEDEDLLMYYPIPRTSSVSMSHFISNSDKVFIYRNYELEGCWFQPYVTNPPTPKESDDQNDWELINFIFEEQTFFINRLSEVKKGFCKNIFEHKNKKVFSIVRNPIDRLFSIWNYCTNPNPVYAFSDGSVPFSLSDEDDNYKIKDFNEFVKEFAINGLPEKYSSKMFLQMSDILDVELNEKITIFKFEEIDKCINYLKDNYNIQKRYLPHNQSNKKIEKNITENTCEIIRDLYKKDFERFGY